MENEMPDVADIVNMCMQQGINITCLHVLTGNQWYPANGDGEALALDNSKEKPHTLFVSPDLFRRIESFVQRMKGAEGGTHCVACGKEFVAARIDPSACENCGGIGGVITYDTGDDSQWCPDAPGNDNDSPTTERRDDHAEQPDHP